MSDAIRQGETLEPRHFGPFGAAEVKAYAEASGDDNPLHVDPAVAAKAGLARPPIHGMLIMGCFQSALEGWRAGTEVRKLSLKFIKPVLVGDGVTVSGKVVQASADAPCVLRLMVKDEAGVLVGLGEAFVLP